MSPPIQKARKCTTNILPCRIHKTGSISATERYWSVQEQDGGANVNKMNKVAYFRGRKLLGKEIKIEDDYRGIVARVRDDDKAQLDLTSNREQEAFRSNKRTLPGPIDLEGKTEEDGEDEIEDAKTLEEVAEFQEVIVWGHEDVPGGDDTFVRGIGEWLSFTECIHNYDGEPCGKP